MEKKEEEKEKKKKKRIDDPLLPSLWSGGEASASRDADTWIDARFPRRAIPHSDLNIGTLVTDYPL